MAKRKLGVDLSEALHDVTLEKCAQEAMVNAQRNLPHCKQSILELPEALPDLTGKSAIILAAGPSLHRQAAAEKIRDAEYDGILIATESAMSYCIRNGLVPHVVVTVDPHPKRIVRFFGDPELSLEDLEADDYFRRQDLDPQFRKDEIERNAALMKLIDEYGSQMKMAAASCASESVVRRCLESKMDLFWWNPMYDDYDQPGSIARQVHELNGLPCMNAGGNVGTSAWVIAHSILGLEEVALVGMDLSYYEDTSYLQTQYYYEILDLVGEENIDEAFIHIENPYLKKTWFTDPTYYWYRETILAMAAEAPCRTYNCTEGGILFGDNIDFITLKQFLDTH